MYMTYILIYMYEITENSWFFYSFAENQIVQHESKSFKQGTLGLCIVKLF